MRELFRFPPHIDSIPLPDETKYIIPWNGDCNCSPFWGWVRGDAIYMVETNDNGIAGLPLDDVKSYSTHFKDKYGRWMYYSRSDYNYTYTGELYYCDNEIMVALMNKILAEHQLQTAIESTINQNRN